MSFEDEIDGALGTDEEAPVKPKSFADEVDVAINLPSAAPQPEPQATMPTAEPVERPPAPSPAAPKPTPRTVNVGGEEMPNPLAPPKVIQTGSTEQRIADEKKHEEGAAAIGLMAAPAVLGPLAASIGGGGAATLATAARAGMAGGPAAAARILGPAASTAGPIAADVLLGEANPSISGTFSDAADTARKGIVRYFKGGGERGAAYLPVDEMKAVADRAADVLSKATREYGGLRKYKMEEGFSVADRLKQGRVAEGAMGATADAMARAAYKGFTKADYDAGAREYPVLRSMLKRANAGQQQALLPYEIQARMAQIEARLGPQKVATLMQQWTEQTSELYRIQARMGKLPPLPSDPAAQKAILDDYANHIVSQHHVGRPTGSGARPPGELPVGSSRKAVGSFKDVEMDSYLVLQKNATDVLTAARRHEVVEDLKDFASMNAHARAMGVRGLGDDLALYNFAERGGSPGVVEKQSHAVRGKIEQALRQEKVDPKTGDRYRIIRYAEQYTNGTLSAPKFGRRPVKPGDPLIIQTGIGNDGKPIEETIGYVMPRDLAENLQSATRGPSMPLFARGAQWFANKTKSLILSNNIAYNVQQALLQDPSSVMANAGPEAVGRYAKNLVTLTQEALGELAGKRSNTLERMRRQGTYGGHFMDFFEDTLATSGEALKKANLPFKFKGAGGKVVQGVKEAILPNDLLAQVREAAGKEAYIHHGMKKLGMSERQAVRYAHERSGNYWERTPISVYTAPLTQFLRWPARALSQVSLRALEDPKTAHVIPRSATALSRALRSSPAVKGAALAAIVGALNYARDPIATKRMWDAGVRLNQPLLLYKDDDGQWVSLHWDGYRAVVEGAVRTVEALSEGHTKVAAQDVVSTLGRRASALASPLEVATDKRLDTLGPLQGRERRDLPPDMQREANKLDYGMPLTDAERHLVENTLGTPARYVKNLAGRAQDGSWIERLRLLGAPVKKVNVPELQEHARYRKDRAYYEEWANEINKPKPNEKRVAELEEWAGQQGNLLTIWADRYRNAHAQMETIRAMPPKERAEVRRQRMGLY